MKSKIEKQDDGTIKLTITIPSLDIEKTKGEIVDEYVKTANVAGFRTGKAPKKLIEDKIDKEKVREEVLKKLLSKHYIEAVKEHGLTPIINPKIHVEKLEDGKDWEFIALTCEVPKINLNNYKDNIQKITAKSKIIVPGKEPLTPKFEDIMKAMLDSVTVSIPKILTDQEVDRLLSQTLDEIKKLGLSLDQYLASSGKTVQSLREEYAKKAETDIKIEFALQEIAEAEKITVEQKEIEEAVLKAKDENERKNLEENKYLLANILRQQKTLDFLKNL